MPIDYSKYPPNWKTEIVPAIRGRSHNRCEFCGLRHGQTVYRVKAWFKIVEGYGPAKYQYKSIWFESEGSAIREHKALTSSDPVKRVEVVLTVAHLDHDEGNHEVKLDRLKHLCQICHLRYDAKEKYRRSITK